MQVSKSIKSPTQIVLTIGADHQDLEPIRRHVLSHFKNQVKVPGFRAGKAPFHMVEKHVNQKALLDEFMEHAINDLYRKAVKDEKIRPVSPPEVKLKKFVPFSNLEFEAEVESLGQITVPDYKKIKLNRQKASVTAKEVNDVLASLAIRNSERKEVERPAKTGDEAIIDFSGTDQNGPVAGTEGKDFPLTLGSGSFIPGFEENIVGLKPGDSKQFDITFPKDYAVAGMQGLKVTFEVNVKKLNELTPQKIDDKFAAKIGPFKTVAELKADVKKQLLTEKQNQADRDFESKLIKEISETSKVDIPPSMVEEQLQQMEEEEKRNLAYRGQTWQEHLTAEGITEQAHRDRQRPTAAERVKAGLVLSEIATLEGVEVTPKELELRIQILKGQYQDPTMQAQLDKPENRQDIAARLLTEKTIQKLVDYATK